MYFPILFSKKNTPLKTALKGLVCLAFLLCSSGCKKFVQIPPPSTQIVGSLVFSTDGAATQAITGIYSQMMGSPNLFSSGLTTFYAGMSADELYYYTHGLSDEFLNNKITRANHGFLTSSFWNPAYYYIYTANSCIAGLRASTSVSADLKNKLIGEALFIRAFCYFYLVNLFGDVPLITTPDYRQNATRPRDPQAAIYAQMIADLKEAQNFLSADYPTPERVRPNKWAATALLARVYLYQRSWANAEAEVTALIESGTYSLMTDLNQVFLRSSTEAIWQLQPSSPAYNTWEAYNILSADSTYAPQYLFTPELDSAFEAGDRRKAAWTASRVFGGQSVSYPYKYKVRDGSGTVPLTEFYMVLRLGEQYLIRAEARAEQNNLPGALADLNVIRTRAGLPKAVASDQSSLLLAIEKERRIELFCEWGHRWLDLKRTQRAGAVLKPLKPSFQAMDTLWPIPISQLMANPALTQNAGY